MKATAAEPDEIIEHPVLFTAPNIRAIRGNTKTQTRRIITQHNTSWNGGSMPKWVWPQFNFDKVWVDPGPSPAGNEGPYLKVTRHDPDYGESGETYVDRLYPRWQKGDRLWVRETHGFVWPGEAEPTSARECNIEYRADLAEGNTDGPGQWPRDDARGDPEAPKWRSSIHMPRWACRDELWVVSTVPQRLQEISLEDAEAEGFSIEPIKARINGKLGDVRFFDPIRWYACLWDTINPKVPWVTDPWVWATTFTRQR